MRRSGLEPVFLIVMYPAATLAPFGVARDHGSEMSSEPAL
jgi:hypothetical protein